LAEDFAVANASEDALYAAMDWLLARQDALQKKALREVVWVLSGSRWACKPYGY
jgi:hypothetical protein